MHPVDALTLEQAARILGVARSTVQEWVAAGRLTSHGGRGKHRRVSQADVEQLAAHVYPWWEHTQDPESYWLTSDAAAGLLGVSRQRLGQLGDKGFVPFVRGLKGVRLYRRAQLETVANARDARWH